MPLSIFSCSEEQQKWGGKTMESDLLLAPFEEKPLGSLSN
jgi:hypothetical protein